MGLIACGWWDSARRWSYLNWGPFAVSNRDSGLSIYWEQGRRASFAVSQNTSGILDYGSRSGRVRLGRPGFARSGMSVEAIGEFRSAGTLGGRVMDPVFRDFCDGSHPAGESLLFIPHWCLMSAAAGLWLGLIYWKSCSTRDPGMPVEDAGSGEVNPGNEHGL
ncbi:hypothetical protein [Haloferula sp. BvORR071]|uniref:hypothetical protein n=1 Tax=Haloferula sp. BvORR071 TaxID=1396141 RepID=UPI0005596194|nr:hypothetical protein [Haloferula sp. BvORR071]